MLSRAGLNRLTPHATAILLLSANAPDLDALGALGGSLDYIRCHRGILHSFVAAPFLALAAVALVRLFTRKPLRWGPACLVALAGVLSHLLLDWTNAYGIRLLLPFSTAWLRLDITSLIDLWIAVALGLAAVAPLLSRLVSAEIGACSAPSRAPAIAALCFFALFDCARYALHERAIATLDSRMYANHVPLRVAAFPVSSSPLRWRGLVEGTEFYAAYDIDLLKEFDPSRGQIFYKPDAPKAVAAALATDTFQQFLRFSQYPFWRVVPLDDPEHGARVEAMDLRFGPPSDPHFVATAILDGNFKVHQAWFALRH
jgi:inner membrane protein